MRWLCHSFQMTLVLCHPLLRVIELKHFQSTHFPVATDGKRIDIVIGQSDKLLLTVLEKREGASPEESNYVLTRLWPIASGGRVSATSGSLSTLRV